MTYFGFLALFLGIPIALMAGLNWWDKRRQRPLPAAFSTLPAGFVLVLHIVIALVYTTPWDNYLVATGVWWYDETLVTGLTIGWVPIEEYTFFVVQPIFTGLWLFYWFKRLPVAPVGRWEDTYLRRSLFTVAFSVFLIMVTMLATGWQPGTYLALELSWAALPLMLQFAFGGDILWRYWRQLAVAIIPTTLYLALADALAIQSGTWTIDPAQSLNIYLGGVLPIEEFIFFLITNAMLVFGMTLAMAAESRQRARQLAYRFPVMGRWLRAFGKAGSQV